ncbi:MAG: Ferrous-iron efflux pump FieF [candidate division WS2 bacterium]|nr:Ferrous-iron efflux pump FieF [Candidatus Lithacetigena glycinireducens]MBT9174827.1 Ferrous-iron efflux pump FieF [Candidatus Lithacetigena glycinireducens]
MYNILEGLVSIFFGYLAGSIALIGFGLDSFIESISGGIMIWRFGFHSKVSEEAREIIERKATKLVAYTFFILGAYVFLVSINKLITAQPPEPTLFGIIIAVISLVTMPTLYYFKTRTAKALNSHSLQADTKQTLACMFLSLALLIGLGLNYLYGFWQADPIVGLLIVSYLFREGWETLKEEKLCSC